LAQQFPNDAGAMAPLFLNYLLMAPGESFFMAANEPHAYVAGEIIECMACSDNVVRAGLTPKFKDVETLVDMLTYSTGGPSIDAGAPMAEDSRILRYTPPVPEFEVLIVTVDPGESIVLPRIHVPAVFVIVEGTGMLNDQVVCQPGRCYYQPANAILSFCVLSKQRGCLKVAVAHKNLHLHIPTTFSRTPNTSAMGTGGQRSPYSYHHHSHSHSGSSGSPLQFRHLTKALSDLRGSPNQEGASKIPLEPPFNGCQWK
jgi:mannose-6-phosphate isomerase